VDEVDRGQYNKEGETAYVNGCLMLVKKEVFKKIGLFDPKFFMYLEDTDFCLRAQKSGFKLLYAPKAVIWHLNAGSSGVGSALHDYFISRNRLLFGLRWAPVRSKLALIKESLFLLLTGREWQKKGASDFYLGKFGKGSWDN
jgi:GT2 family glycosyltransferase